VAEPGGALQKYVALPEVAVRDPGGVIAQRLDVRVEVDLVDVGHHADTQAHSGYDTSITNPVSSPRELIRPLPGKDLPHTPKVRLTAETDAFYDVVTPLNKEAI
jgi:hypothetical protein